MHFSVAKNLKDIPDLLKLSYEAHKESRFSYIQFSEEKAKRIAINALENPSRHGVFLARAEEQAIGFSHTTIGGYYIGCEALIATVNIIYVNNESRNKLLGGRAAIGLIYGIRSWAEARGAKEILINATSGINIQKTHTFIKKMGYSTIGGNYSIKLH